MSILTGFKKVKNYILTSSGYQLLSRWTSSQTVEFDDGKTAQAKLGEINGIAKTYVDMKKAIDNSMAASAKAVMEGLENSSALISMTQAEYDALSDEERTDNNMRAILDANPDVVDAKNVNFDNTDTNLTATNTQSAITELNGKLDNVESEKLADNLMIYRYGKLRILYFNNYTATVNAGSFQSLNGLLKDADKPGHDVVSCNLNTEINNKYGISLVQISTSGLFVGYVIDDSQPKGYRYLTGNPKFNGSIVYLVS